MKYEQDRELDAWLSCYDIPDLDARSRRALLDVVMSQIPVRKEPASFGIWRAWRLGWGSNAAAFAVVAAFGFWVGNISPLSLPVSHQAATTVITSDNSDYLDQMIFGSTSWKEVSL